MTTDTKAPASRGPVILSASLSPVEARRLQRMAREGKARRIARGIYVEGVARDEARLAVREAWERIAGALAPGGVVSHATALRGEPAPDGSVTISHPSRFGKTIRLPGLLLGLAKGPGPLPGDTPIGGTGLHRASVPRMLLENLGRSGTRRAGRDEVRAVLSGLLDSRGEGGLAALVEEARGLVGAMRAHAQLESLVAMTDEILRERRRRPGPRQGKPPAARERQRMPRATLGYFGEVVRCGSVRHAADRLYVAASAVSRQIAKLEEYVGTALFDRRAGGMRLTEAGRLLADWVARTEREWDHVLEAIDDLRGLSSGKVSIATVEGMIDEFFPTLLHQFRTQFPAISLSVRVDSALAVMEAVAADECDIGVSFNVPPRKSLLVTAQHAQPIVAACSPRHPLASRGEVKLSSLAGFAVGIPDLSFGIRRLLDDAFSRKKLSLEPHLVSNSLLLLKSLAKQGDIVTFMPTFAIRREVQRGDLVAVHTDSRILNAAHLDVCIHAPRKLSFAAQEFLRMMETRVRELR
jgi:DNA-binding transcriptional LysR family regulator